MGSLKVISYNVKGLHSPIKRKKILNQLRKINCQIAFLQETHLSDTEHDKLKKSWADKVFYSSHQSGRRRGVSILIHRRVNFLSSLVHKDSEGRFILVNGSIDGTQVSLMNIYAPNEDIPGFISKIFTTILQHSTGILLLGGDFNCTMSQFTDRQPSSKASTPRMSKMLKYLSTESGLVDVWRSKHPKGRDFTFYSHRHSSYSRTDLFFTPKSEMHRIEGIKILPITLSDHAPLELIWDLGHRSKTKQWRLNASLLNDKDFLTLIKTELKNYLDINTSPEISPLILWDCAKAYIRGCIISFASAKKKRREAKQTELEDKIKKLEQQHKRTPTSCLLDTLKQARRDLNILLTEKIEANLRFTNQKYYENGNRASRLLALRLKKQQSSNIVHKLQCNNSIITRPDEISQEFAGFYKSMYSNTDTCTDDEELAKFLNDIELQELSESMAKELDEPIRESEIQQVISTLKNNKSPGPDGYINEFYKTFKETISPLLLKAYHYALQSGTMAPSWREATIVVIHKEGKDPTKCESYRPISLLNTDLRILTAILARRVNRVITQIIHPDQTGFITGRNYGDNIRRLLNLVTHTGTQKKGAMILSLDAQKAFDRVSWKYLFQLLKRLKFGPSFIKWIQTLYSDPQAAVKVNGFLSDRFALERGCRQGCSLSPLLFNICIEPLAQLIRDNINIKGLTINGELHKLSLYADDVLLYLTEPATTIPHLKDLISTYGFFSGYKVNVDKTIAMDISGNISQSVKLQSGFKWPKNGIRYLGIQIPPTLKNLYNTNYKPITQEISRDLDRWSTLPLSLLGRIESLRMNIIPKLLYLFQMLPIDIPKSTFDKLDRLFSKFIWQGRRPRVRLKTLQLPKSHGGLKLPHLRHYFWAAQLRPLTIWIQDLSDTRWLNIEKSLCATPLHALPFIDISSGDIQMGEWTRITLNIWRKIKVSFGLPKTISALTDIGFMKDFAPSHMDAGFRKWSEHGLSKLYQLYQLHGGRSLKSLEQLKEEFKLPNTDFFRYLQLRTFLTKHKEWDKVLEPTPIEESLLKLLTGNESKKIIGCFYHTFSDMTFNNTLQIKRRWETEMNADIPEDTWDEICTEAQLVTNSNSWREFKWKVIMRFFRTPAILSKLGPAHSSTCWRNCATQIGNHTHIFWTCTKLKTFWEDVFKALEMIFHQKFTKDPTVALLGLTPVGIDGRAKKYLLQILITAALKCITIKWLKPDPPTYSSWTEKVLEIYHMERMTYTLRLQKEKFMKRWNPAITILLLS
uniref:Reverse transcriptase domain-containing protein n=1 Tax=Amphiprion percula TaxID=161767 RepID=A0A3P8SZA0_AMPPE